MPATMQQLSRLLEKKVSPEDLPFIRKFADLLFRKASADFFEEFDPESLLAMTMGALRALEERRPGGPPGIRVHDPKFETEGWEGPYTVLELTLDDQPFIVDSVKNELARQGVELHHLLHPIYYTHRESDGRLQRNLSRDGEATREVYELYLISPLPDPGARERLIEGVLRVLRDVTAATEDYRKMLARLDQLRDWLEELCLRADDEDLAEEMIEYRQFLEWLKDGNFVFLGYREYDLVDRDGTLCLKVDAESGLGILRGAEGSSYRAPVPVSEIPDDLRTRVLGGPFLLVTKANAEATVHRRVRMDYIGLKKRDDAGTTVRGEHRFLGLFTTQAMSARTEEIPILRRKLKQVLEMDDSIEGSHDYKQIRSIFDSMPLEELFWSDAAQIHRDIRTIMAVQQGNDVRLTLRPDPLNRGLMAMVVMPRDRFNAEVRQDIQELLTERVHATRVDYQLSLGEDEQQARLHFFLTTEAGVHAVNMASLEREVTELTRTWEDRLVERLVAAHGEAEGRRMAERYSGGFSDAYRASITLNSAVRDLENLERIGTSETYGVDLVNPVEERGGPSSHLRIYHRGYSLVLSDTMPILENLGLRVLEQASFRVERRERGEERGTWGVDIFRVQDRQGLALDLRQHRDRLVQATLDILNGRAENDRLNHLVLSGGLTVRQVALLRAYAMYHSQLALVGRQFVLSTLLNQPRCAALLHRYFEGRFSPASEDREGRMAAVREEFQSALGDVSSLPEDRVLRNLFNLMEATVRTNYYLTDSRGEDRPYLSFKVRSGDVQTIPEPRPMFEIVVVGPGVEAIHLRGGRVARGGLRWSDRPDFRTEVLGLMKTQMVKNAVIVPVGAKGAFVLKHPPAGREALHAYLTEQYRTFIRGMLDLTDNLKGGEPVHPPGLVIYDEADPYLVVAADKGTATMSDVANEVSAEYGFWLGDAFASGGTYGYDHKKEGITARGAWECVSRHFREMGIDIDRDVFTAAGLGDMSGDVFGNGLLRTDRIKLQAAFNHLHIFLDPNPEPAVSFRERQRLFNLPRSTWEDYDPTMISPGGGVFLRAAKSIPLSPQVQRMLGTEAESLSGEALVRAILTMPVDLLWNGGIGTYVRASSERDADVGDSSNDPVRVVATDLRCRVVGEGGNGGLTQLARVEYARQGGRLNTDAIDNSGGVDMSDHEVNIKILLQPLVQSGELGLQQRNRLLGEMTDEVSRLVLRDNYTQSLCLSMAETRSCQDPGLFASLLDYLVERGTLHRQVEQLPERKVLDERARAGQGLTRPELSILLSYTKQGLYRRLLETDFPDEPTFQHYLFEYFPKPLQERFAKEIARHRLRREIIATQFTNTVVDLLGITFVHRTIRDTGATPVGVIRAALAALEILQLKPLVERLFALDNQVPAEVQYRTLEGVVASVETAVNWMLLTDADLRAVGDYIGTYRDPLAELRPRLETMFPPAESGRYERKEQAWRADGLPEDLAAEVARLEYLPSGLGVVEAAATSGRDLETAARCYYLVGDRLALGWLRDRLVEAASADKWEKIALVGLTMDLQQLQRDLAVGCLRGDEPELDAFLAGKEGLLERYDRSLAEIQCEGRLGLSSGAVLARLLSQMARLAPSREPQPAVGR